MANSSYKNPPSNRLAVSSLLSPPELKRSDSFGSLNGHSITQAPFPSFDSDSMKVTMSNGSVSTQYRGPTRDAYASPPISPYTQASQKGNMDDSNDNGVRDPQLFRTSDAVNAIAPDQPLFPPQGVDIQAAVDFIDDHMKSKEYAELPLQPAREDYLNVVSFASTVYEQYNKNPRAWYIQERSFDHRYGKPTRVEKKPALKKLAPAPSSKPRQPKVALPRTRVARPTKRTPPARVYDSFDSGFVQSPSPKPPRPATNRDDTDYKSLPDYSPSLETLPRGNSKALKADWKGQVLDLSNDPDRNLLHEAELNLASTLRLTCATYLCSKRRIFQGRIEALKIGKEFRKTDAQQACKIDVNKASKLWQAYDKVGWFKPEYFQRYLV